MGRVERTDQERSEMVAMAGGDAVGSISEHVRVCKILSEHGWMKGVLDES